MISFRPLMNSERFLHRESIAYARATFPGSRVFQLSSASRTFWIAVSRVNGGKGGRVAVVAVVMSFLFEPLPLYWLTRHFRRSLLFRVQEQSVRRRIELPLPASQKVA